MKCEFTRDDTKIVKGVAILWMIAHHLFAFWDKCYTGKIPVSFQLFKDRKLSEYLGDFGQICVSLFMFLGGYGIYKIYESGKLNVIDKLKKTYISYWKVFVIFIPIGFIFFSNQSSYASAESAEYICHIYQNFDLKEFVANFVGLSESYNREWWFFKSYIIAIISFPLILVIMKKFSAAGSVFFVIFLSAFWKDICPWLMEKIPQLQGDFLFNSVIAQHTETACFWLGCIMAKYDLLVKFKEQLQKYCHLNIFTDIICICLCIVVRNSITGGRLDLLMVPVMCIVSADFIYQLHLRKVFKFLGENSTNMWLIHTFFCFYFEVFAKVVYSPKYAVLVFIVEVAISLAASCFLTLFWNGVGKIIRLIGNNFKNKGDNNKQESENSESKDKTQTESVPVAETV